MLLLTTSLLLVQCNVDTTAASASSPSETASYTSWASSVWETLSQTLSQGHNILWELYPNASNAVSLDNNDDNSEEQKRKLYLTELLGVPQLFDPEVMNEDDFWRMHEFSYDHLYEAVKEWVRTDEICSVLLLTINA